MPIFGGILMTPRSMRGGRTSGNLTETSRQNIQQSRSDPMNIRRVNTDESSVFSGIASIHNGNSAEDDENQVVRRGRLVQLEILPPNEGKVTGLQSTCSSKSSNTGRHLPKALGITENLSEEEEKLEDFRALATPRESNTPSGRSVLRNLMPVADCDSAFTEDNESSLRQPAGLNIEFPCNQDASTFFNNDDSTFCQNDASTLSYGSVNNFQRPRGKIRLLSNIQLLRSIESSPSIHFDDESSDSPDSPPTPEGAEEISRILKDFGNELDENLMSLRKDSASDHASSIWQDISPPRVRSEDDQRENDRCESRELEMALQQAQSELDVLRDNNDQYISELEQTEEEHESEMKLYDERIKQKMFELKEMYREEIDALIREKDAAIAEAGLQAAQHAEAGRKQIASLQKEMERLKLHTKQAMRKAIADVKKEKDEELISHIAAIRAAHEIKLENLRRDTDNKLQSAVNEAVAMVTKNLLEERNRERKTSIQEADFVALQLENAQLLEKQNAMVLSLRTAKDNLSNQYSKQLEDFQGKAQSESPVLSDSHDLSSPETLLGEVVQLVGFLLKQTESKLNVTEQLLSEERTKKERNEVYVQTRKDLMLKHRAELELARKQVLETKEKVEHLEKEVKTITEQNRILQEELRSNNENHRQEVLRLQESLVSTERSQRRERSFNSVWERRRTRETGGKDNAHTSDQNIEERSTDNDTGFSAPPVPIDSSGESPRASPTTVNFESRDDVERLKSPTCGVQEARKVPQEEQEESQRRDRSFHSVRERRKLRDTIGKNAASTSGQNVDDHSTDNDMRFSAPQLPSNSTCKSPRASTLQTTVNVESRDAVERSRSPTSYAQDAIQVTQDEQEESRRRDRSFQSVRERRKMRETLAKHSMPVAGQNVDEHSSDSNSGGCAPPLPSTGNVEKYKNAAGSASGALKVTQDEQDESQRRERSFHSVRERRRTLETAGKLGAPTLGQSFGDRSLGNTTCVSAPLPPNNPSGNSPQSATGQTTVKVESETQTDRAQKTFKVTQEGPEESQRRDRSLQSVRERRRTRETLAKVAVTTPVAGHNRDDRAVDNTTSPSAPPPSRSTLGSKSPRSPTVQTAGIVESREDAVIPKSLKDSELNVLIVTQEEQEKTPRSSGRSDAHNIILKDHETVLDSCPEAHQQNVPASIPTTASKEDDGDLDASYLKYMEHQKVRESGSRSREVKPLTIVTEKSGVQKEQGPIQTRMDTHGIKESGRMSPYANELARKKSFGLLRSFKGQPPTSTTGRHAQGQEDDCKTEACQPPVTKARGVGRIRNFLDVMSKNDH